MLRWVDPQHLYAGTPQDNTADMVRACRQSFRKGARQNGAKIKASDVVEIYLATAPQRQLARVYGVSPAYVAHIQLGKRWTHITDFVDPQRKSRKRSVLGV